MDEQTAVTAQRVGDAERDAAVTALQEHHVAGRLDRAEFDARMGAALSARTRADLVPLFVDLPRSTGPTSTAPAVVTAAPAATPRQRYGVPAVASAIWPLTILACILLQNWALIAVPIVLMMVLGRGSGCGAARRSHVAKDLARPT